MYSSTYDPIEFFDNTIDSVMFAIKTINDYDDAVITTRDILALILYIKDKTVALQRKKRKGKLDVKTYKFIVKTFDNIYFLFEKKMNLFDETGEFKI